MRLDRTLALSSAIGVLLTAFSVSTALTTSRADGIEEIDYQLTREAVRQRDDIDEYFERARSITLIAAQNPAFRAFYQVSSPASSPTSDTARQPLNQGQPTAHITEALGYLRHLYPDRIGEACFIDLNGTENARVIRGKVAATEELSEDESANPFFAPSAALGADEVYQAAPYLSPDTNDWVVSNSATVFDDEGRARAILHFEITLASFRERLGDSEFQSAIVETSTGKIIARSSNSPGASRLLVDPGDTHFPVATGTNGLNRTAVAQALSIDSYRFATVPTHSRSTNANEWTIVAGTLQPVSPLVGFDAVQLGLAAIGILIVAASILSYRVNQSRVRIARVDELTGLWNRRHLLESGANRLRSLLSQPGSTRSGPSSVVAAVLMIDLDRFKEINDTLGHAQGDEVLRQIARRLSAAIADENQLLARLGGDEFAVLMAAPGTSRTVTALAAALHQIIDVPIDLDGLLVRVGASIGVALAPTHGEDMGALLQHADIAMYDAKRTGKGVTVYDPASDPYSPARLSHAAELRRAIEHGAIDVHYQPKVHLATNRTAGFEALARWTGSDGRAIPADEFIPLTERSGLMLDLTRLVLDQALGQLAQWHTDGFEITVAVNISPTSLLESVFVAAVADALHRHRVQPRYLVLELTETAVMDDPERSLRVLEELHRIGVSISIDDFGTGYSSLGYLRRFPVSELKIDRSFVQGLGDTAADGAIVEAAINLGHSLGLRVVAEGVEDEAALQRLRSLGCDQGQGYLLSRPLVAAAAAQWLATHRVLPRPVPPVTPNDASALAHLDGIAAQPGTD